MTSGFDGATASAPTDDASFTESKTGYHVSPALVVFQTPPTGKPASNWPGCPIAPDTADTRPARKGPMLRQERPASSCGGTASVAAGVVNATMASKRDVLAIIDQRSRSEGFGGM